jgi:hypothetical protein
MCTVEKRAWWSAMSPAERHAWFNLTVILLTLGAILAVSPALGFRRAQGSLGFLGLLGLGPFLFRRRPGKVFMDERDVFIQLRAWTVAYSVFWLLFVGVCVAAPFTFGSSGTVAVELIQMSVWYAFMLVWGVGAIATLAQYRSGASHASE